MSVPFIIPLDGNPICSNECYNAAATEVGAPPIRDAERGSSVNMFTRIANAVNRLFGQKENPVDALARIAKAASGLLYSSEADYPLEPFTWESGAPFAPDKLYTLTSLPASAPITPVDFNAFFA